MWWEHSRCIFTGFLHGCWAWERPQENRCMGPALNLQYWGKSVFPYWHGEDKQDNSDSLENRRRTQWNTLQSWYKCSHFLNFASEVTSRKPTACAHKCLVVFILSWLFGFQYVITFLFQWSFKVARVGHMNYQAILRYAKVRETGPRLPTKGFMGD